MCFGHLAWMRTFTETCVVRILTIKTAKRYERKFHYNPSELLSFPPILFQNVFIYFVFLEMFLSTNVAFSARMISASLQSAVYTYAITCTLCMHRERLFIQTNCNVICIPTDCTWINLLFKNTYVEFDTCIGWTRAKSRHASASMKSHCVLCCYHINGFW